MTHYPNYKTLHTPLVIRTQRTDREDYWALPEMVTYKVSASDYALISIFTFFVGCVVSAFGVFGGSECNWLVRWLVGLFVQFHQYQVVGRALPTEADQHPKIYRMKLWATNEVRAKSKFWYCRNFICLCKCVVSLDLIFCFMDFFHAGGYYGWTKKIKPIIL